MVEETTTSEQIPDEIVEQVAGAGPSKIRVYISMPVNVYEEIKDCAEYAVLEGLIEGHPQGNVSDFCNWCMNLGVAQIKQYMLKKRGFG